MWACSLMTSLENLELNIKITDELNPIFKNSTHTANEWNHCLNNNVHIIARSFVCKVLIAQNVTAWSLFQFTICQKRIGPIARLQSVQNCLARVVTKAPRFNRFVPILKRLHWLPVKFRIYFKICSITFRTLKDNQPAYIWHDLLCRNSQNI